MNAPVPTADGATPLALAGATTVDFLPSAFFGDSLTAALLKIVVVGRLLPAKVDKFP